MERVRKPRGVPKPRVTEIPKGNRPGSTAPVDEAFALEWWERNRKPRYRELLHLLGQRQYLETGQLARLFYSGTGSGVFRILSKLNKARMIWYCVGEANVRDRLGSRQYTWFLDWNGMYAFKRLWPDEPLRWDPRYMGAAPRSWAHTVQAAEVWLRALETACDPRNRLGGVGWLDEWSMAYKLGKAEDGNERWFRPDGMLSLCFAPEPIGYKYAFEAVRHFTRRVVTGADGVTAPEFRLELPDGWVKRSCWIEVDMGTQSLAAHFKKAEVYTRALINATMWQRRFGGFGLVLIITTTPERAKGIIEAWKQFELKPEDRSMRGMVERKRPVGVATWSDYAVYGILGPIWRASYCSEPVDLFDLAGEEL